MANEITLFRLNLYESIILVRVQEFDAGVHTFGVAPYSNSILSTLWVKSIDAGASVQVKWYDIGPGGGDFPGEKIYLKEHDIISSSDVSDRQIITKLHNKAYCEITVTGGKATLGVYVTSISSFPQDAPYLDEYLANLAVDGGNANVIYDDASGKFFLTRGQPDGSQNVYVTGGVITEDPFTVKRFYNQLLTTPSITQALINETIPSDKNIRLRKIKISTRAYGYFQVKAGGDIITDGYTSAAENNTTIKFEPYWPIESDKALEVSFVQSFGAITDVSATAFYTEQDN